MTTTHTHVHAWEPLEGTNCRCCECGAAEVETSEGWDRLSEVECRILAAIAAARMSIAILAAVLPTVGDDLPRLKGPLL